MAVGLNYGPRFDNAQPGQPFDSNLMRRYVISRPMSERVASYIRNSTDVDARILSPDPTACRLRRSADASGFPGHLHLHPTPGAEYVDAIRYLEPAPSVRSTSRTCTLRTHGLPTCPTGPGGGWPTQDSLSL